MASVPTITEARERIKDEHYLQNLIHQHESALEELDRHKRLVRQHEGTIGDHSNTIAVQKRRIQQLEEEIARLKNSPAVEG